MRRCKQKGFNLVELMVGMVISLIVIGGAVYVFVGNAESNIFQMRSTRFVQQMRDVMDRMVQDIRRAGYQGYKYYAQAGTLHIANPFDYDTAQPADPALLSMGITTSLTVAERSGEAADSCVTYAYNLDDDYDPVQVDLGSSASLPSAVYGNDGNELFGFQLRTDSGIGAVWMRKGGGAASFDCNSGEWERVTDPELVDIERLEFTPSSECRNVTDPDHKDCGTNVPAVGDMLVVVRKVDIAMTGKSRHDDALTFTLDQTVELPNDRTIEVQ